MRPPFLNGRGGNFPYSDKRIKFMGPFTACNVKITMYNIQHGKRAVRCQADRSFDEKARCIKFCRRSKARSGLSPESAALFRGQRPREVQGAVNGSRRTFCSFRCTFLRVCRSRKTFRRSSRGRRPARRPGSARRRHISVRVLRIFFRTFRICTVIWASSGLLIRFLRLRTAEALGRKILFHSVQQQRSAAEYVRRIMDNEHQSAA